MSRPRKCRRVCFLPQCRSFTARGGCGAHIELALDELEALRLADLEELDQDAAAEKIGVSRGTFQRMLYAARRKTASALVNGWGLRISGGDVELAESRCSKGKACGLCRFANEGSNGKPEGGIMILAVTTEGGSVFQHFGQCKEFTVFEIEGGAVKGKKLLKLDVGGHGMNASFLKASKVETLICGGIGPGAQDLLKEQGIAIVAGVEGKVDDAVKAFLAGSLDLSKGPSCKSHHEEGHGHSCSCSSK